MPRPDPKFIVEWKYKHVAEFPNARYARVDGPHSERQADLIARMMRAAHPDCDYRVREAI